MFWISCVSFVYLPEENVDFRGKCNFDSMTPVWILDPTVAVKPFWVLCVISQFFESDLHPWKIKRVWCRLTLYFFPSDHRGGQEESAWRPLCYQEPRPWEQNRLWWGCRRNRLLHCRQQEGWGGEDLSFVLLTPYAKTYICLKYRYVCQPHIWRAVSWKWEKAHIPIPHNVSFFLEWTHFWENHGLLFSHIFYYEYEQGVFEVLHIFCRTFGFYPCQIRI